MLPFKDILFCEVHKTETEHTIYFIKYTKDGVLFYTVCEECRKVCIECGIEMVDANTFILPAKDWFDLIPFEDYCEIAN